MDGPFEHETLHVLPDVLRFAKSLERDADAAEDLVQETYLRAYAARDTFDQSRGARQWMFTICRNAFLRSRERARWFVEVEDDADLEAYANVALHNETGQAELDRVFAAVDFGPALERAVAQLPDAYRVVFALVDIGDCSYDEVAQQLDIPVGTVRSRLFRARRELQGSLIAHARDHGITTAAPRGVRR